MKYKFREISQQNFHRRPRKLSYYTAFTRNSKILWSKIERWKKVLFERTTWSNEEDDKKKILDSELDKWWRGETRGNHFTGWQMERFDLNASENPNAIDTR